MPQPSERGNGAFTHDIAANEGYLYTTNARLSSRLANRRLTEVSLALADFSGKRILDIGCGDGAYTMELFELGQPAYMHGFDISESAICIAKKNNKYSRVTFAVHSAYRLPYSVDSFDIAYLRGVLHHMSRPLDALREALRVAPTILVIEPNGLNPVLKVLERCSDYHLNHEEKSYTFRTLNHLVRETGGRLVDRTWVGMVPMFCPDWFARLLKRIEPTVERIPIVKSMVCSVYVFLAARTGN